MSTEHFSRGHMHALLKDPGTGRVAQWCLHGSLCMLPTWGRSVHKSKCVGSASTDSTVWAYWTQCVLAIPPDFGGDQNGKGFLATFLKLAFFCPGDRAAFTRQHTETRLQCEVSGPVNFCSLFIFRSEFAFLHSKTFFVL